MVSVISGVDKEWVPSGPPLATFVIDAPFDETQTFAFVNSW